MTGQLILKGCPSICEATLTFCFRQQCEQCGGKVVCHRLYDMTQAQLVLIASKRQEHGGLFKEVVDSSGVVHLHLHLVIWQTLLSKATYNWGIHKAIHLEEAIRQRKCS